jgi:hypothetical protein
LGPDGLKTGPHYIQGLGIQTVVWEQPNREPYRDFTRCSGTGCQRPDPVVIMSGFNWAHYANWSDSRYFVTLEGIRQWADGKAAFTCDTIRTHINATRPSYLALNSRAGSAIRRLLDSSVGDVVGGMRLMRAGSRWKFRWEVAE